jgi:DNA replication licensing factor MCM4
LFATFLDFFRLDPEDELPFYHRQLHAIAEAGDLGDYLLNLNCTHLYDFPSTRSLYYQLLQVPQEMIPVLDHTVNEKFVEVTHQGLTNRRIQVRTFGLRDSVRMRSLNPEHVETLLCIKGMVIRCSSIIPDLKQAFFRCAICNHVVEVGIDRGKIEEPSSCPACQTLASLELIHNRCAFTDKQMIRLQETPDEIPEGETPYSVTIFAFDDLVDTVRPGDRIEVTGIFRAVPRRANPRQRSVRSVFKTYIDGLHFRRADLAQAQDENVTAGDAMAAAGGAGMTDPSTAEALLSPQIAFSDERLREFYNFAAGTETVSAYERLAKSFAPSIWEMDDVKKGLLCLLFGGTVRNKGYRRRHAALLRRLQRLTAMDEDPMGVDGEGGDGEGNGDQDAAGEDENENSVHQRGDINILLCGDPGTSKSQLLSYVHKLTPRGIYTSGKGSSAVGLTASVVRDPETRDMVLESGALVLSDQGICCIDEFDKMTEQTRAILHEAMEQQTVSVTKAGIIATLNARTSILASANPTQSRYNPRLSVVDNIKLPPTLLSRFDLIYLVLDKPNMETDRRLAQHLVSLYYSDEEKEEERQREEQNQLIQPVDQTFLKEYILFARNNIFPDISQEAENLLVANYLEMRSLSGGRGVKTISATPRQLESLIRLSQALAKMRLSEFVTANDVKEATRLMKVATQTAATDPRTGTIDMDLISTGRTALDRDLVLKLAEEIRSMLEQHRGQRLTVGQIRQQLLANMNNSSGRPRHDGSIVTVSMAEVEDAVRELEQEGLLQFIERTQTAIIRS